MHPLLSREEISALLDESEKPREKSSNQLTIEMGQQCIMLEGVFDLNQGAVIEINSSLDRSYEIRSKDQLVAYGVLAVLDGKLVLQITHLIDYNDCHSMG
jgi:flagellar motor switch/type III secretory pathway protein FliN